MILDAIQVINQMCVDGVIDSYAIGGAVGATFYLEPMATMDLDVFIVLNAEEGRLVVSLQPIYDYLVRLGCKVEREYIIVGGWPVQFLPVSNPLLEEALVEAVERDVSGVSARVFSAEHLAAMALQTGRAKDLTRLLAFIESGALNKERLHQIITRHKLIDSWSRFEHRFLAEQ